VINGSVQLCNADDHQATAERTSLIHMVLHVNVGDHRSGDLPKEH
jgi:hypothetical protein